MIGQIVSHYRVAERIGGGGMGVVYRAQDLSLGRHVALKFLPPDVAGDAQAVERLKREARAAAALNHPNICAIYEIGTHEGEPFIAMELVVGETLDEAIGRPVLASEESSASDLPPDVALLVKSYGRSPGVRTPRPLALPVVLELAVQLADALDVAHREGVIHRDIKPSNIVRTPRGQAKILDFGLAKLSRRESDETGLDLTREGSISGTIAYMSPEQALGRKLDGRTDIFSLGAVLYEISTGQRAFEGATPAAIYDSILNRDPESASRLNGEIPDGLERIIRRTLEKDPGARYANARELFHDLERLRTSGVVPPKSDTAAPVFPPWPVALSALGSRRGPAPRKSIAVLPFVNMSSEAENDYLGDGLAEELINAMTRVDGLRVVSRTSAFQFKGRDSDIRTIGESLNVDTLLEGSVRRSGRRVRINAQLINVSDGYHLWSEQYDREMNDIFELQDDIARQIVGKLRSQLSTALPEINIKRLTANVEAYNRYLKGRYHLNRRTEEDLLAAIESFRDAARRDPGYSLPHAGLAEAYILLNINCPQLFCDQDPAQMVKLAVEAANEAIRLDSSSAEAHVALAMVSYRLDWNWDEAERHFRVALELDDRLANAHHQYALFLASVNRVEDALREIERAYELDPESPIIGTAVGRVLQFARRFEEAVEHGRRIVERYTDFSGGYFDLAMAYGHNGQYAEALETFRRLGEVSGDPKRDLIGQAFVYARIDEGEKVAAAMDEIRRLSGECPVPDVTVALVRLMLGETDEAFRRLDEAYSRRDSNLVYLQCEPTFDPLRSDPRFKNLLRRMNFERYSAAGS